MRSPGGADIGRAQTRSPGVNQDNEEGPYRRATWCVCCLPCLHPLSRSPLKPSQEALPRSGKTLSWIPPYHTPSPF